ncbi:unnamed protein product [Dovyalis caffra]|uniref:Maturase K n=1 Tax=Dovyalis caffra TaxID=77055 RepID=A0AAV1RL91_9ROSI|nr:unnamed protein product [Dovyalis caffra]
MPHESLEAITNTFDHCLASFGYVIGRGKSGQVFSLIRTLLPSARLAFKIRKSRKLEKEESIIAIFTTDYSYFPRHAHISISNRPSLDLVTSNESLQI